MNHSNASGAACWLLPYCILTVLTLLLVNLRNNEKLCAKQHCFAVFCEVQLQLKLTIKTMPVPITFGSGVKGVMFLPSVDQ